MLMKLSDADFSRLLKKGVPGGVYFFFGDEDYLKNARASELKRAVLGSDSSLAAFNCFEFCFGDGEFDPGALTDALLAPPMMGGRKYVSAVFSSVDSLKSRGRSADPETGDPTDSPSGETAPSSDPGSPEEDGKKEARGKNRLLEYLRSLGSDFGMDLSASDDTVFLIRAVAGGFDGGRPNRPSAFLRDFDAMGTSVEFPYQTEVRLIRWMERHFADYGLVPDPEVCPWILRTAGKSMYALSGEVEKTAAYAAFRAEKEGGPMTATLSDARASVISADEDDAFGLADCVTRGDMGGALRFLRVKMNRKEEPVMILGQVSKAFSDLYAAASFSSDGRDASDLAFSLKMNEWRAKLCFRAAAKIPPARYAAALRLCLDADRQLKSGVGGGMGSYNYAPVERLICALGSLNAREEDPSASNGR